jgi:hypothetical protein
VPMVHQLGYTLSWSGDASAMLSETGEGVDYGCRVLSCGYESSVMEGILCNSSRCQHVPRNPCTCVMLQHSGKSQIIYTFKSLGICPSKVHLCPTMIVVSTVRTNLVVDTVTLTFLSHWSM